MQGRVWLCREESSYAGKGLVMQVRWIEGSSFVRLGSNYAGLYREGSNYAGKGLIMQGRVWLWVWLCREGSSYAG